MGYCIHQGDSRFHLDRARLDEAFMALKALAQTAPGASRRHFAWVDTPTLLAARDIKTFLSEWRWEAEFGADGSISAVRFEGEKLGDDIQLMQALGPFVKPGSYIVMHGEDGAAWRWFFTGVTCIEQAADVRFPDAVVDVVDVEAREVGSQPRLGQPRRLLPGKDA